MTSTTFFIIFIPILAILLLAINLILAPHNPYQEKDSVFECGFHSFLGQNRTQVSVSFFIFALLFLLFDLEILLVYPYSVSGYTNDIYGLVIMMVFFVLLTLGFIFELGKNALTIDSRQTSNYGKVDSSESHAFLTVSHVNSLQSASDLAELSDIIVSLGAYLSEFSSFVYELTTLFYAFTEVFIENISMFLPTFCRFSSKRKSEDNSSGPSKKIKEAESSDSSAEDSDSDGKTSDSSDENPHSNPGSLSSVDPVSESEEDPVADSDDEYTSDEEYDREQEAIRLSELEETIPVHERIEERLLELYHIAETRETQDEATRNSLTNDQFEN
jgi:NADH-ubiquinone oxidoreductase chain 3